MAFSHWLLQIDERHNFRAILPGGTLRRASAAGRPARLFQSQQFPAVHRRRHATVSQRLGQHALALHGETGLSPLAFAAQQLFHGRRFHDPNGVAGYADRYQANSLVRLVHQQSIINYLSIHLIYHSIIHQLID